MNVITVSCARPIDHKPFGHQPLSAEIDFETGQTYEFAACCNDVVVEGLPAGWIVEKQAQGAFENGRLSWEYVAKPVAA